jgi:phosphotransferase system HPr (HPr) family protein
MRRAEVKVIHPLGLHARLAFALTKISERFKSTVTLGCDGRSGNGKDVMDILALGAGPGSTVIIETAGEDEEDALKSLKGFFRGYK